MAGYWKENCQGECKGVPTHSNSAGEMIQFAKHIFQWIGFNHQLVRASRFFLWQFFPLISDPKKSFAADLQDTRTLLRISDGRHYILAILAPDLKDKLKRRDLLNLSHMDELVKTYSMPFWTKWRGNLVVWCFFCYLDFQFSAGFQLE